MQHVRRKVQLYGQILHKELFVKVLPCLLTHEDASTLVVFRCTAGPAHHLKDIHDRITDIAMFLPFIGLDAQSVSFDAMRT